MKPEASPLMYIATLLGLTTLPAQQIFNQNMVDGLRRDQNVICTVGFQILSLIIAVEIGLPQKVQGLWVQKWVSIKVDGPGLCKGLMAVERPLVTPSKPRARKLDINNYGQANGQLITKLTHGKRYILVAGRESRESTPPGLQMARFSLWSFFRSCICGERAQASLPIRTLILLSQTPPYGITKPIKWP